MKQPEKIWIIFGLTSIIFHIFLIFSGLVPNLVSRPLHMALIIPWVFLYKNKYFSKNIISYVFVVLGVFCCLWTSFNHELLSDQYGFLEGDFQTFISLFLLLIVLEMARRSVGWPLPLVSLLSLLYGMFGNFIPGEFGHPGIPINSFLGTLTIAEGGIWGTLTGVSVSIVAIFVIFGSFLNSGEAGSGFMNIAIAFAGRLKGGAAKVSVISSALFGSISGSASANVASTGMVTLPAMLKLGYPRRLAASVEAVASSGGQIMPPLMGAGAFVMVELTGVPYNQIILAALLPAILFFFAVWVGIDFYSKKYDLKPINKENLPKKSLVLLTSIFFFIPFSVLLIFMYIGFTPQYSAAVAILVSFFLLFFNIDNGFNFKIGLNRFFKACISSGSQISLIGSIILCASIIIGILSITGLGVKLTSFIISASGNNIWPALLLTGLACLVLGMEVPTTAAYVICVSVAGPALVDMGLELLQVHLFVFWFALLSTITPPVCGTVFIAAGMVSENWLKVSITSMSLGIGLYFIPLAMIANKSIIELNSTFILSILAFVKIATGLTLLSYSIISKHNVFLRLGGFFISIFIMFI
ncbi:TRAP transporter fused permease subunit [Alphaproteobacteria bacterium]|nr:TRAP transporter fused permease subunit [Alphaproteobacteria bacterium]